MQGCIEWEGNTWTGRPRMRVEGREQYITRLLWTRIFGPIPLGLILRHSCDNPRCINLEHLSLGTQNDNIQDAVSRKRHSHGEGRWSAKLTGEQVAQIRVLLAGGARHKDIAKQFGVSRPTITEINTGSRWKSVA